MRLNQRSEMNVDKTLENEMPLSVPYGSGTRAGLFRTPISGGVQSATSAHGLPRPALAVRNLMEQVSSDSCSFLSVFREHISMEKPVFWLLFPSQLCY